MKAALGWRFLPGCDVAMRKYLHCERKKGTGADDQDETVA